MSPAAELHTSTLTAWQLNMAAVSCNPPDTFSITNNWSREHWPKVELRFGHISLDLLEATVLKVGVVINVFVKWQSRDKRPLLLRWSTRRLTAVKSASDPVPGRGLTSDGGRWRRGHHLITPVHGERWWTFLGDKEPCSKQETLCLACFRAND